MVSVWRQQSRMVSEDGFLAGQCSSGATCRAAACKRICCCSSCTVPAREEAARVWSREVSVMRQSPWEPGRAGSTALVQGREQELCPKLPHSFRGDPVASQSSTASQSKGTHGQWTRGFDLGTAAWDRAPVWGLAGPRGVFAEFRPQKNPKPTPKWLLLPSSLLLPLLGSATERLWWPHWG